MRRIQDYLGFQLLQVHKAYRARAEAALNKLGLHPGQEMLLLILWLEEGIPQSQLAASMGVEPPTATKMIQRMEQALLRRLLMQVSADLRLRRRCAGSPLSWESGFF